MLQALKLFFPMDKLNWLPGTVPVLWASLPETHREQTAQNIELLSQMVMTMFSLILLRHYFFFSQYFFCLFLCCRSIFFNMSYQNHFYVPTFPTLYFFSFESFPLFHSTSSLAIILTIHLSPSQHFTSEKVSPKLLCLNCFPCGEEDRRRGSCYSYELDFFTA